MKEIKTVALVGLGAIGAYFADRLQPVLGDDLRVIAGGARAERIRREGLVINGKQEYYHVVEPGEGEPADLVIFATKMSGLQQAIEDVRAQIGPETLILSPLNGVESEEVVAKTYGWENIVYSLMRISSVKVGNTVSFDPNAAFYVEYGEKKNDPANLSERVLRLKALFDGAGIRYQIRPDMLLAIWEKFACNVSENQVAAVLDLPYGAWGSCEDAAAHHGRGRGHRDRAEEGHPHRDELCARPSGRHQGRSAAQQALHAAGHSGRAQNGGRYLCRCGHPPWQGIWRPHAV